MLPCKRIHGIPEYVCDEMKVAPERKPVAAFIFLSSGWNRMSFTCPAGDEGLCEKELCEV